MRFTLMLLICLSLFQTSFANNRKKKKNKSSLTTYKNSQLKDSVYRKVIPFDLADISSSNSENQNSSNINIDGLLWFAKKQLGVPYKYAAEDPKQGGLDCSGFLYYVFGHFNIKVPRTSNDYLNFGSIVSKNKIQKGDVLVFTGSNAKSKVGGHVGIVLENNNGSISFIHSASGNKKGVMISNLSENYFKERFLKAVRIIK
ncbi:MAG: C40 family peptidase [Chitinophagales bacterium]